MKKAKTSRELKKSVIKKSILHEDYKKCLFTGKEQLRRMNVIRSYKHEIYTEEVNKIALSFSDDKRHILDDGVYTLALGHYKIYFSLGKDKKIFYAFRLNLHLDGNIRST